MPVEIRELVIRAVATMEREDTEDLPDGQASSLARNSLDGTEAIVQECVRQVLRILQKEKER
jgi:hypothetical protein